MSKFTKIKRMYVLSFLFSLHIALSAYVNSTFLIKIISEKYVGILFAIASFATLFLLSKSASILKHFGNRNFILWSLLVNMLSLVGMITSKNAYVIGTSFVALMTTNTLVYLSIDIFIEHYGDPQTIGKTRGLYLTIINLAWMLTPLITALLITKEGGYVAIYILSLFSVIVMTVGLLFSVKNFEDSVYKKIPFIETYRFLKTNHHMASIMIINFLLQFFFAWMIVYTPIYLFKHIGLNWEQIGVIFTIMLSPFVIFGLPIGILIDKYHIKKRTLLYVGFIIMIISTSLISTIKTSDIVVWSIILFLTRTGASIIETTSEIYIFTHIKEEETFMLSIFRDMTPLAYIIAPVLATVVFIYLPFNYLFLVLSVILLAGFYYIPKLKHNNPNEDNLPNTDQQISSAQ
jgi:MFS family permease